MSQNAKSVTLAVPIEWQGQRVAELTVRRPKVKDLRVIEAASRGSQLDQGVVMIAQLTGLPSEAVDELDAQDFTIVSEAIADFFPKAKASATGASSSPKPPTG